MKHLRKEEHKLLKRVTALLCAAMLVLLMVPREVFTAWAEESDGVELTLSQPSVMLNNTDTTASTITLSLTGEKAENYTASYEAVDDSDLVDCTVAGNNLTLTPKAGAYGETKVTMTATLTEKQATDPAASGDPEGQNEGEPSTEPETGKTITKTATIDVTVNYTYQLVATIEREDGKEEAALINTKLKVKVTEQNSVTTDDLTYTYQWKKDGTNVESATESTYTPTSAGNYTVEVTASEKDEGDPKDHLRLPSQPIVTSDSYNVGKGTPNITQNSIEFPEKMTYGDKAEDTKITLKSFGVAGEYVFHYDEATENQVTVPMTAAEDKQVTAEQLHLDMNAGEDKELKYTFTPDNTGDYETISEGKFTYTVERYEITVRVTVPGKRYDGTTDVKYYDETNVANQYPDIADSNQVTDSKKITYGLDSESHFVDADKGQIKWKLGNIELTDFEYENAGDISQNTEVNVNFIGTEPAKLYFIIADDQGVDSVQGENTNYKVTLTFAKATIEKNTFADAYELQAADYYLDPATSTYWFKGTQVTLHAKTDYTLSDTETGSYTNSVKVSPEDDGSVTLYAKSRSDLLAEVTVAEKLAVDSESPTVQYVSAATASGIPSTSGTLDFAKESITYTFHAADENGSGVKNVHYAVTTANTKPADSSQDWKEATLTNGTFQVIAAQSSYVWVKAEDNVGNDFDNGGNSIRALVIETNKPVVTVSPSPNGTAYAKSYSVSIKADDEANVTATPKDGQISGIQSITSVLKDEAGDKVGEKVESYDAAESVDKIEKSKQTSLVLPEESQELDGEYTLFVTAKDFSGNESEQVEATLLFDTTPPEISIAMGKTDPADTYYYRADNCGITVTVADAHTDIAGCTVTVTNGTNTITKALSDATKNADGSVTVTLTADEVAALDSTGNTTVTVSVTAEDELGNSTNVVESENVVGATLKEDGTGVTFVLDTVAPELTAVACAQTGKGPYQDDGVNTYYYNDAQVQLTFTVEETNFETVELSYQRNGTAETPISPNASGDLTVSLTSEGLYSNICISGVDKAGNRLTLGFASSAESAEHVTEQNGVITMAYNKVIDRTAPKAVVTYTSTADAKKDTDGSNNYYYNASVSASVAISDDRSLSGLTWEIQKTTNGGTPESISITKDNTPHEETLTQDGKYHFTVNSENMDRAGNKVQIVYEDSELGSLTNPTVVIDTVAPVASFAVSTSAANTQLQSEYNSRYYFNSSFSAELKITDENYDASLISAKYGYNNADDYQSGTVTPGSAMSASSTGFTYSSSGDGLYQFEFSGTDKAGNKLTLGSAGSSSSIGQNPFSSTGDTLTSYVFVVDTAAPTAEIKIGDYYAATLSTDGYHVSANSPYRKEKEATLSYTAADKSPVKVECSFYTSLSESTVSGDSGSFQKNATGSHTFTGEQIFAIDSLTVTDLAGNSTSAPQTVDGRVSNKIYLDATSPTDDQLTPMVKLVAKESGQGRSTAGVDLYDGTVTVEAIVSEPGYSDRETGGKSSGLYTVYYEVLQNNSDNFTPILTGTVKSAGTNSAEGLVRYGSGNSYSEVANEKIVGKDTLTFTFDAAKFNYNDISLRVWAEDNSGNVLQKENGAVYRFGIDTSSPSISVRYDNNSAQNSKYFKENRTAQITVHERNFDPSRTVITTQAGANAGWTYQKGTSQNGDDDTWTTTVSYATDGDYTLAVSTTDLVGHSTAEVDFGDSVAPREFTIDKTPPVISVSFDNDSVKNGKYYNKPRTATVLINEHNFGASAANVAVSASIQEGAVATPAASGWSSVGDSNTASVAFSEDGNYAMQIQFTDLAGNAAQAVTVDEFTVDTTAPVLNITGVENRVAYGDVAISPSVVYHDINYDSSSVSVSISGYKHTADEVMNGTRVDEPFGGSFICDSIAKVRSADDIYTATGTISDLAGNTTTAEVQFSVNRFGSNYILSESSRSLVGDEIEEGSYYTNQSPTLEVTEVNVNTLVEHSVNTSWNGSVTELTEGEDYEIETTLAGWSETTYRIFANNFEEEGAYIVTLTSEDEAENHNTNRSVKGDNGVNSSVDLNFNVDKTAPTCFFTGVSGNERYNAAERDISVNFDDNSHVEKLILSVSTDDGASETIVAELNGDELSSLGGVYHYVAQAANDWQVLRVTAIDAAGNSNAENLQGEQLEPVEVRYLLTTSLLVQYVNSVPALVATGVIVLGGGAVVVLLLRRRRYMPKKMK